MIIDAITLNVQGLNLVICSASLFLEMNDNKEEESRIKGTIRPKLAVQPVRRCGWFLIQVTAPEFHRWTVLSMECMMDVIRINMMKSTFFPRLFFASQMSTRGCRSGSRGGADPQRGPLPPLPGSCTFDFFSCKSSAVVILCFSASSRHWDHTTLAELRRFEGFVSFVWTIPARGNLLAGILSLCETLERLHGPRNVRGGSVKTAAAV